MSSNAELPETGTPAERLTRQLLTILLTNHAAYFTPVHNQRVIDEWPGTDTENLWLGVFNEGSEAQAIYLTNGDEKQLGHICIERAYPHEPYDKRFYEIQSKNRVFLDHYRGVSKPEEKRYLNNQEINNLIIELSEMTF